jgi:hypothetical protein
MFSETPAQAILKEVSVTVDEQDTDGLSPAARDAWLVNALRKQISYMRAAGPYWSAPVAVCGRSFQPHP